MVCLSTAAFIANWIPGLHTLASVEGNWGYWRSIQLTGGYIALVKYHVGSAPRSKSPPLTRDYGIVAIGRVDDAFNNIEPTIYRETAFVLIRAWVIAALLMIYPTCFMLWGRRRKAMMGECKGCNYDLTGNQSGICPECGEAVEVTA